MSMCSPCKRAADKTTEDRLVRTVMKLTTGNRPRYTVTRPHACAYPHSCTCQHDRREPVPVFGDRLEEQS